MNLLHKVIFTSKNLWISIFHNISKDSKINEIISINSKIWWWKTWRLGQKCGNLTKIFWSHLHSHLPLLLPILKFKINSFFLLWKKPWKSSLVYYISATKRCLTRPRSNLEFYRVFSVQVAVRSSKNGCCERGSHRLKIFGCVVNTAHGC